MKIKVNILDSLSTSEIEEILSLIQRQNGLVFHEPKFNEIVSEVFKTKLIYFFVYNKNNLVAFCTGHERQNKFLKTTELKPLYDIPYGGWVFDSNQISISELIKILPYNLNNKYIYSSGPVLDDYNYYNHRFVEQKTAIVDLSLSNDEIWSKIINSKRRNMVRKALKERVTIEKYNNNKGVKLFWPILNELHSKLGLDQLTFQYYSKILDEYFLRNKAQILLARKNNEVISGMIIIGNPYMFHYWKGASKQGVKNDGQGDFLQWEAIKWAKSRGVRFYDLCVIDTKKFPHIAKFKLGFSKMLIPFYRISKSSLYYKVINRIQKVI